MLLLQDLRPFNARHLGHATSRNEGRSRPEDEWWSTKQSLLRRCVKLLKTGAGLGGLPSEFLSLGGFRNTCAELSKAISVC